MFNKLISLFKKKDLSIFDYLLNTNQYNEFVFLLGLYLNFNNQIKILELINEKFILISDENSIKVLQKKTT